MFYTRIFCSRMLVKAIFITYKRIINILLSIRDGENAIQVFNSSLGYKQVEKCANGKN